MVLDLLTKPTVAAHTEALLLHFNRLSSRYPSLPGSTVGYVCEILPLVSLSGT